MNGPYHPMATLDPIDRDIIRLKKRLQVNLQKQRDPNYTKKKNEKERLRRKAKRESDPEWWEEQKRKQKEYYKKNPQVQIRATLKWNKKNRDKKNATNRRSYEKNKVAILARRKEKRRLAREAKNG